LITGWGASAAEAADYGMWFGVVFADADGRVCHLNPVAESLTGWNLEQARGQSLQRVFPVIDRRTGEALEDPVSRLRREGGFDFPVGNALLTTRDGGALSIEGTCARLPSGYALAFRDHGRAQRLAHERSYEACHDPVTGLVNRAEFLRRAEDLLAETWLDGTAHAMVYLDLDQFKVVNDTCGHDAGDELLRQVSTLLLPELRDADLLARLGGDEFGLLLRGCTLTDAERLAARLIACIRRHRFTWQDSVFVISASAGVAPFERDAEGAPSVLAGADTACFTAKERGRGRVQVYHHEDSDLARHWDEMRWVSRIAKALGEERFRLHFQRIAPIRAGEGEEHLEALIYLCEEDGTRIEPAAFIPAAERYNLMPAVDSWVVSHALHLLSQQPGGADAPVLCINLSASTLCDEGFPDHVRRQFAATAVPPRRVCFEITETAAISNLSRAMAVIEDLKGLGCRFALDDFGRGISSFGYLKTLRVDYLKIDGAFVRDMVDDPVNCAMVAAINEVGHVMGLKTIAEFAETEAVIQKLREIGVDYAQGYGIARPEPLQQAAIR